MSKALVAGLHLRWDSVRQRPQHILTRLARRMPVVVVEEPFPASEERDVVFRDGEVTIVRPLRTRGWSPPFIDEAATATIRAVTESAHGVTLRNVTLRSLEGLSKGERPDVIVWLYTPMMLALADAFPGALVYDVMDELAQFDLAPDGIVANERILMERADVVFTGGRSLYAARAHYGAKVHCEPSGVEFDRFAVDVAPHPLPAQLRGPVLGYVGVVDERLDVELIAALAEAFPDGNVVIVGPPAKIDLARFPRRPNLHLTGAAPYDALPSWLAGFDVALMPFARNAATEYISPTKTLEYFAARKPVVSTGIADVVAEFSDAAYVADGADRYIAAVRDALTSPPDRLERGVAHARTRSWDAIAARMFDALEAH